MVSGSSAVSDKNVMRCPKCDWVSVTKVEETYLYIGLAVQAVGDSFICTNPKCNVEKIYGTNGVLLLKEKAEG